jgi:hypothetical protein
MPHNRKLLGATLGLSVAVLVLSALFFASWEKAETISLEAHYVVDEKLTYNLTTTSSDQRSNTTSQSTLTIQVLNVGADSYTFNYTLTPAQADATPTTQTLKINKTDVINLYTLMPAALLQYTQTLNSTTPIESATLNQKEIKLGDTLQIPVICAVTGTPDAEIALKLKKAERVEVAAGAFEVFRLEFAQVQQSVEQCGEEYGGVLGWALLEVGSYKQMHSMLEFNMTTEEGSVVTTFQSTLLKDER